MQRKKLCIVGSGVTGLTTALSLLGDSRTPPVEVTIISDRPMSQHTSIGPVGLFHPFVNGDLTKNRRWARASFEKFKKLWRSNEENVISAGLQLMSCFIFSDNIEDPRSDEAYSADIVSNFHWLSNAERELFHSRCKYGISFTTFTCEGQKFLPWLQQRCLNLGARFCRRSIKSLSELYAEYDVIVNCAGLNAGALCGDPTMKPERGVLIQVSAPWLKHCLYEEGPNNCSTYLLVGQDTVFLGSYRQLNNYSLELTDAERADVWQRCTKLCPAIKGAPVIKEWVGLRPVRDDGIRLEKESVNYQGRTITIVHNYGHGGNGFTMSFGTASDAVALILGRPLDAKL